MHDYALMIEVTELYYYKKLQQKTIAKMLGISIATVSRILNEALNSGLIEVKIVDVEHETADLIKTMENKYGLHKAIIINTPETPNIEYLKKLLGKAAYDYLIEEMHPGSMIGIGPGSTIYEFVEAIDPQQYKSGITLMPLMGGWSIGGLVYEVNRLLSTAASKLHCDFYLMPCPALISSEELKNILMREPLIEEICHRWDSLDMAIFSLGGEVEASNYPQLRKSEVLLSKIKEEGAVGDILGRFIDNSGNILDIDVNKRMMSIPVPRFFDIPMRIGIAGGASKIRVLRAALKAKLVNVIVSDAITCKAILEMEERDHE
jgi:deoxyribonucleoside regulator